MANKLYIAIDSDILRTLAYLNLLKKEHGFVDREKVKDHSLKKDLNYFLRLFKAIQNDEIRPLIVDAVFQESKHSETLVDFMREYCYFPNVNAVNYQEKAQKARELANLYCHEYTYREQVYKAPMKSVFVADINKYVPTNDCYIMAQATIENCFLLTSNGQDFIFDKRNEDKSENDRVKGIARINILNGYCEETAEGSYSAPRPLTISNVLGMLKYDEEFTEQVDDKVKADTIL